MMNLLERLFGLCREEPPSINKIVEEGERERMRAAMVVERLKKDSVSQDNRQYATWEELFERPR